MINNTHLKNAFALYAETLSETLPCREECALITFSPRFERRMKRLLKDYRRVYFPWFYTIGRSIATILLVLILGLSITTVSVKALREKTVEFILSFFDTHAIIDIENQTSLRPEEVTLVEPTYLPADFLIGYRQQSSIHQILVYGDSSGNLIHYSQTVVSPAYKGGINTENSEVQRVVIHGYDGILSYRPEYQQGCLIFATEYYLFEINGKTTPEEMIKIAESIPLE